MASTVLTNSHISFLKQGIAVTLSVRKRLQYLSKANIRYFRGICKKLKKTKSKKIISFALRIPF